ncbi:TetR/AcrR family transcriptional regulator [Actinoplanes sp. NEAU-A12]|uniref:TetR/AcrR family transcriptional regulator n=1 Tax=Actinoplanes sandaracinus TaxID=3045177 RepID=A0ABT6WWE4_9ACTN|nr:TetR/AcrR family transcriptional regulator [Actinoplanes sandaracinus]MDI6104062.1 TetR/AcrR family transcriptional regulator [Actinoplanes sandaracinus]
MHGNNAAQACYNDEMPKVVDHDQRRADLVRAVWAVIGLHGIEGATVRRVAEQAGVSMGGLRYYFDSQQGLLRFAALAVAGNVSARVRALLQSDSDAANRARLLLEAMLPVDQERRVEADVWLAFLIRSRVDDALEELRSKAWTGTRHICRLAVSLRRGVAMPETIGAELPDADLETWAQHLHMFVDGLTVQAVTYPDRLSTDDLRVAVHRQLALVADR